MTSIHFQVNWTPLMIAVSVGSDKIVDILLSHSNVISIDAVNSTGQCSLHYAASKDRYEVSKIIFCFTLCSKALCYPKQS